MYKCTHEGCDKVFDTEPKRRGHLGTHKSKKRAPGKDRRIVRKKYYDHPTRSGRVVSGLPASTRRPPVNNIIRHRNNAEPLFGDEAIDYIAPEVNDQAHDDEINVPQNDEINVPENDVDSESDLDSTIDPNEQYVDLSCLEIDVLECRLPNNQYIYAFPSDSSVESINKLIKGIYEKRRGQIIVLCGGHGFSTGDNWHLSDEHGLTWFKAYDQNTYDDIFRAVQRLDRDSDDCRLTLLNLQTVSAPQINDVIRNKNNTHVIFAFCDSIKDRLFALHLEPYRRK